MGNQGYTTTSGGSGSNTAAQGTKHSEVSMSFLEDVAPAFNPRRLPLTHWTQSWSIVKVSYLFGRRSSSFTPDPPLDIGGLPAAMQGQASGPSSRREVEGASPRGGFLSSRCHFQLWTHSLLGVEEP